MQLSSIFLQGDEVQSPTQGHLSLFCILSFNSLFQQPSCPTTICLSLLACSHSSTSSKHSIYILFNHQFLNPLQTSHNGQYLLPSRRSAFKQGRIESHTQHGLLIHDPLFCESTVHSRLTQPSVQAQTPQQRRANAKFAKDQEARRGKSSEELKKKSKVVQKSPISPFWLGMQ